VTGHRAPNPQPAVARTILNVISNWGGQLFALALGFFMAPFVVHRLGDSAYGVWSLAAAIAGYLTLLDLGVRGAVTRYVARFAVSGQHEQAGKIASAALQIFCAMAGVAVLVAFLLAVVGVEQFDIPAEYRTAARIVIVVAGLNVGISLVSGVYAGMVAAMQRFDLLNLVDIVVAVSRALAFILVLRAGYDLIAMAVVQLIWSASYGGSMAWLCRRVYPELRLSLAAGDRASIRMIFSFSILTFLIHVSGRLIYYTDALIIATFLPIGLLTLFSIAAALVEYARNLVASISYTTSLMASTLDAVGDMAAVERVLLGSGRFSMMILLPVALTFLIRGESFIGLWMGAVYAGPSSAVLAVLALPLLVHASGQGLGGMMIGIGRHQPMVPAMIVEGAANVVISAWLVRSMGIIGVAWGTAIPALASSLLFWPWYIQRAAGISAARYFRAFWSGPFMAVVPFAVCTFLFERFWPVRTLYGFAVQVAVCLGVVVISDWFICFSSEQRSALTASARQRMMKLRAQVSVA
jgi:O-antigen/teichoic acid export membrane protein